MGFNFQNLRARALERLPGKLGGRFGLESKHVADDAKTEQTTAAPTLNENALDAPDGAGALMILDIVFSDFDWSLTVTNPITQERIIERRDDRADALSADSASRAGPLDSLRAAIRSLAPGERAQCGSVRLWPADPAIEIFDNRAVRSYGADQSSMAQLAERLLGAPECGFDSAPYGRRIENEAERRLISACRLDRARAYLAALGDLSIRITSIAPATVSWMAQPDATETRAVLHIGIDDSLLVVSDAASGVVAQRHIRVGAHAFAALVSDTNSLPMPEAVREMAERDMVGRAASGGGAAPLETLADVARETLAYFTESRLAEPPRVLEAMGAFSTVKGLDTLLSAALGIEVAAAQQNTPMAHAANAIDLNLLRGPDLPLFSDGTKEYRFKDNQLVGTELDERTQQRTKANASGAKGGAKTNSKPPQKFFGLTLPQFGSGGSEITPAKLAAVSLLGAGLIGFLAFDFAISPASARLARAGGDYDAAQSRIGALEAQLGKLRAAARQDAFTGDGADKILWAEKFAAVAAALPPSVWLTGANIANTDRRIGDIEVVTTKLVLQGITRAKSDHRLQDIAQFIQSLEQDEAFMRDFRRIVFAGLGSPGGSDDAAANGVAFEVHAWYDENKRKATRDSAPSGATGLISTAAGTAATRAAVGARLSGQATDPASALPPIGARP